VIEGELKTSKEVTGMLNSTQSWNETEKRTRQIAISTLIPGAHVGRGDGKTP
jgi:hypothetical protein